MRLSTYQLNLAFVQYLRNYVQAYSNCRMRPFDVDLRTPLPPKVRVYMHNCTNPPGGRPLGEYKINLNVGQPIGERGNFDFSGGRFILVAGFVADLEVFVFWDAFKHKDFGFNKNLQVKSRTIFDALTKKVSLQERRVALGRELVVAVHGSRLKEGIIERLSLSIRCL